MQGTITSVLLFLVSLSPVADQPGGDPGWDRLIDDIYTIRVSRSEARALLHAMNDSLRRRYGTPRDSIGLEFRFPLKGYSFDQIRRAGGRGFVGARSYDFLDGNAHKGHPALDIFVYDRDQDCLDDRTKRPIEVVAVADGVILSTRSTWTHDSLDSRGRVLRGGKQVYLHVPASGTIWYYAHLRSVSVHPGDRVRAGTLLGTLGRTGDAASRKRSSTHLHVMSLQWEKGNLKPVNPFDIFLRRLAYGVRIRSVK